MAENASKTVFILFAFVSCLEKGMLFRLIELNTVAHVLFCYYYSFFLSSSSPLLFSIIQHHLNPNVRLYATISTVCSDTTLL